MSSSINIIMVLLAFILMANFSAAQEQQFQRDNGVFFSGLPRLPPGINAIPGRRITAPNFSKFENQFSTSKPDLNKETTPFDFKFNSERPDGRLVTFKTTATTRRFFSTTEAPTTAASNTTESSTARPPPNTFSTSTLRSVPSTTPRATFRTTTAPTTTVRPTPPRTRPPTTVRPTTPRLVTKSFTTLRPPPTRIELKSSKLTVPAFVTRPTVRITTTTPKPRLPSFTTQRPVEAQFPRFSFVDTRKGSSPSTAVTGRLTTRIPTPTRVPTTTTVLLPKTTPRTQQVPPTTHPRIGLRVCDPTSCKQSCREKFGKLLTTATCQQGDCRCEFTEECRPQMCQRLCRENNPGRVIINTACTDNNCECTFKPVCRPSECNETCRRTFGSLFIDAECADDSACKCSHN